MKRKHMTPDEILAATGLGSINEVASVAGVTRQAVYKWRSVPAEHCIAIELATSGKRSRHDLRPDIFGPAQTTRRSGHGKAA